MRISHLLLHPKGVQYPVLLLGFQIHFQKAFVLRLPLPACAFPLASVSTVLYCSLNGSEFVSSVNTIRLKPSSTNSAAYILHYCNKFHLMSCTELSHAYYFIWQMYIFSNWILYYFTWSTSPSTFGHYFLRKYWNRNPPHSYSFCSFTIEAIDQGMGSLYASNNRLSRRSI